MTQFYASLAGGHPLPVCTTDGDFLRYSALPTSLSQERLVGAHAK